MSARTQFERLLNDLDLVARSAAPAVNGYDARYRALLAYGEELERDRVALNEIVKAVSNLSGR